jgi:hypothetical protein
VDPKTTITDFTKVQLYNLSSDPGEQSNLLNGGGTALMQQKALQLQQALQTYIYTGRSTNIPPRNIVNGQSTMLVDFGYTSDQTNLTGWNNIAAVPDGKADHAIGLYDSGGGYTGLILKTHFSTQSLGGASGPQFNYQGPYPPAVAGLPTSALEDGFYVMGGTQLAITLSSLDAHATYDFTFYAASTCCMTYSLYTVTGDTTQQAFITPVVNNASQTVTISGIMADDLRTITINLAARRSNGTASTGTDAAGQLNFLQIIEHLLEVPGDYNGDRYVDSTDYVAWRQSYGATGSGLATDGNHDGVVDSADFLIWRKALNDITPGSGAGGNLGVNGAVPEPTSCMLLATAIFSMLAANNRRRR